MSEHENNQPEQKSVIADDQLPPQLDELKFQANLEKKLEVMSEEQNLVKAMIFGVIAALVGAGLWALMTVVTGYQIGYAAIGMGFLVGYAVKYGGKGLTIQFGIIGGVCALISCILGNYLSAIGMISNEVGITYSQALEILPISEGIPTILEHFEVMDILFYGFAAYFGFKVSILTLDEDDIAEIQHVSMK